MGLGYYNLSNKILDKVTDGKHTFFILQVLLTLPLSYVPRSQLTNQGRRPSLELVGLTKSPPYLLLEL